MFGIQVKTHDVNLKFEREKSRLNLLEEYKGIVSIKQTVLDYWSGFDFPVFVFFCLSSSQYTFNANRQGPAVRALARAGSSLS